MYTQEQIEQAKEFKTVQELLTWASENGHPMCTGKAKELFAQLHPENGEISDDELENVAGGGCSEEAAPYQCKGFYQLDGKPEVNACQNCMDYTLWRKGYHFEWGCTFGDCDFWDDYTGVFCNSVEITNYSADYWKNIILKQERGY